MTTETKQRIVYKLVRTDKPEDGTDVYVGSTSLSLKRRLAIHRHDAKRMNSKLYKRMRTVGIQRWKIRPLLTFACDQKTIREFEKTWVTALNADLNTHSPLDENSNVNKIKVREEHHRKSVESKRYYCDVCDKAFRCSILMEQTPEKPKQKTTRRQKLKKHFKIKMTKVTLLASILTGVLVCLC